MKKFPVMKGIQSLHVMQLGVFCHFSVWIIMSFEYPLLHKYRMKKRGDHL